MAELVELVGTEGEKHGQISLEVLRHGERETVYVTPEARPADAAQPLPQQGGETGFPGGLSPEEYVRGQQRMFNFRNFGPGVIFGGRGATNIPNGVSVSVQKEGGNPARITVKRGDETWTVVGDDEESLKKLPEDLRPMVERMLHGDSPWGANFGGPNIEFRDFPRFRDRALGDDRFNDRLDQMEKQINDLLERLGHGDQPANQKQAEEEDVK
jgi:hypothetical protein